MYNSDSSESEQLLDSVLRLAEALSSLDKLAEYEDTPQDEAFDQFCEGIMDIEYTYSSGGEFLGAEITVCLGGPTIWIETRYSKIVGVWGSDRFERSYEDGIGLEDMFREMSPFARV